MPELSGNIGNSCYLFGLISISYLGPIPVNAGYHFTIRRNGYNSSATINNFAQKSPAAQFIQGRPVPAKARLKNIAVSDSEPKKLDTVGAFHQDPLLASHQTAVGSLEIVAVVERQAIEHRAIGSNRVLGRIAVALGAGRGGHHRFRLRATGDQQAYRQNPGLGERSFHELSELVNGDW